MKTFCNYHPTLAAHFRCPQCGSHYCPGCIVKRTMEQYTQKKTFFFCPKCNVPAESLGVGSFITPFWNRLPKFFIYPLQLQPLLFMVILSAAGTLFGWFPSVGLIIWGLVVKYSYAILNNTAHGNLNPPPIDYETVLQDFGDVFKQFGIYIVITLVFFIVAKDLGWMAGWVFLMLAILFIPAMLILLATTQSLLNALNPIALFVLTKRIGGAYFLMYLFLIFLMGAPVVLAQYIPSFLPDVLQGFIFTFAKQYYTILSYHLMGYVILQYHEEIGFHEVEYEDLKEQAQILEDFRGASDEGKKSEETSNESLLNRVGILVKEGRIEDAILLMKSETRGKITHLNVSDRYYNLLKVGERVSDMLNHAISYLDLLIEGKEKARACQVYLDCVSHDPNFTPGPQSLITVAGWMAQDGDAKEAYNACNKFIKANPQHALTPKAYFLAAKLLHEKLNHPDKAQKILEVMIKKYPGHDIGDHAQKYLTQMNKIRNLTK